MARFSLLLAALCHGVAAAWSPHLRMATTFPHTHTELQQTGPAAERSLPHPMIALHVRPHTSFIAVERSHPFYKEERRAGRLIAPPCEEDEDDYTPLPDILKDLETPQQQQQQPPLPPPQQQEMLEIVIPEGVKPGEKLGTVTPQGVKVTITVPEGAAPGTILQFVAPPPPALS